MNGLADVIMLSTVAGLGTALGGLIVFVRQPGKKSLGFLMGLAAGVMIMLSFLELMAEALHIADLPVVAFGFMTGAFILFLLDFLLPHKHFSVSEKGLIDAILP